MASPLFEEARQFMVQYRRRAIRDAVTSAAMASLFLFTTVVNRDPWVQLGAGLATLGAIIGVVWAIRSRPDPAPTGADTPRAYQRLLDEAIASAQVAPMWTVLPLLPGTACIGVGLVLAVLRVQPLFWVAVGLSVVVIGGLALCWRVLWRARTEHTAELLARREALRDAVDAMAGRPA